MQQETINHYRLNSQFDSLRAELQELDDVLFFRQEDGIKEEMADVLILIEQIVHARHWEADIYRIKYFKSERNGKGKMFKVDDLKEVFELAATAGTFINELMKSKSNCEDTNKDNAKIKSSGDSAQLASSGDDAVVAAVGFWSVARAKKGSWITLCEYRVNNENRCYPYFVKTEYVDGEKIKEDTLYGLYDKEFREVIEVDGVQSLLISQRKHVQKVVIDREIKPSYIFTKDGVSAHGRTVKQAYRDWLFKTSPRDMSEYECLKLEDVRDLNYWAVCYRTITGACALGTENFIETFKDSLNPQMTLQEVISVTEGQYGHNSFKEFFERKENE